MARRPHHRSDACATPRAGPRTLAASAGDTLSLPDTPTSAPPPRKRRRSSQEVAERILRAAEAEFGEAGFAGATTAAIARRAEVTEAQIFRLYESKQDLFRAAIFGPLNDHFGRFMSEAASAEDGRQVARAYIVELQDFMARHSRMLMSLIVASAYSPDAAGSVADMKGLQTYFSRGAAMMTQRLSDNPKVAPELMVRVSFAAVLANLMFRDWLYPPGSAEEDISEAIVEFVIGGIEANGPVGDA